MAIDLRTYMLLIEMRIRIVNSSVQEVWKNWLVPIGVDYLIYGVDSKLFNLRLHYYQWGDIWQPENCKI